MRSYLSTLLLFLLPILIFFHTRGVVTHDEGYILYSSARFFKGFLPYRDFDFVYTPGSLYLTALSFAIFSKSILSSRILMIFISIITAALIFKTIYITTKNKFYTTLAVLLFVSWGPTHINFAWPVMFCIFSGILTLFLLLKFLEKHQYRFLYLAGFSSFIVFLFKQNFGFGILISVAVFFLFLEKKGKLLSFLAFTYGYIWSLILFVLYLLYTNSFAPFVNDFYVFTIQRILIDSRLTTTFIYPDTPLKMILRTLFYLMPLIISLATIILLSIRHKFHFLFIPVFVLVFYILGIRPTTDYVHLAPLLALSAIPLVLYIRFNINMTIRLLLFALIIFLIFLGFETALFKGYYRWDSPLIKHNIFFNNPRVNIFLNDKFSSEFRAIINTIDTNTKKGDYIFVNSYNPMLYFISDRNSATKSDFLLNDISPKEYYKKSLGALVAKEIPIIILDRNTINSIPIKNYIKKHYHYLRTIEDFDIYKRNP